MIETTSRSTLQWSRAFWSELVNRTTLLERYDDRAVLCGRRIRLAWDADGHGTIYVGERRTFVFLAFDPRAEARRLLADLTRWAGISPQAAYRAPAMPARLRTPAREMAQDRRLGSGR